MRTEESAIWHALMTKSQTISKIRLTPTVEAYVSELVIRAMSARRSTVESTQDGFLLGSEHGELHTIGDECLILAGLMPERAIQEEIPVSFFVNMAFRAYTQLGEDYVDSVYSALAANLVDCIDVLHTLREIEVGEPCIDPLNAFELWSEAGSQHAWNYLVDSTNAVPVSAESFAVH
ncbi:MAG: hypothetical protein AAF387_09470 [Pseudomonadota bacterium]